MGAKFRIRKHRDSDNLHLNLSGEFDDTSICDLIDVLKTDCNDKMQVFVHTNSLDHIAISGIGRDVFQRNLRQLNRGNVNRIHFISGNDTNIFPEFYMA